MLFKIIFTLGLIHFCSLSVFAQDKARKYQYSSFEEASKAAPSLKFIVESTKVGLFSSDVPGFVKKFTASARLEKNKLSNLEIKFNVADMDSDDSSRDTKLHTLCLSKDKYPQLKVSIPGPHILDEGEKERDAVFNIRGKDKKIKIKLKLERVGEKIIASGKANLSLKALEIPDPSIAIAKLSDLIRIEFRVVVP
jgi:polyisoprenoid-binding protein YceI